MFDVLAFSQQRVRVLFVFAWLDDVHEGAWLAALSRSLDPARFGIDVLPCQWRGLTPVGQKGPFKDSPARLDPTACTLSYEDTVAYLARRLSHYDVVVSCQDVADIYPALERLLHHPPLIELGQTVAQARSGPKHLTTAYVGEHEPVVRAAATRMNASKPALCIPRIVVCTGAEHSLRHLARQKVGAVSTALCLGWADSFATEGSVARFLEIVRKLKVVQPGFVMAVLQPAIGNAHLQPLLQDRAASALTDAVVFVHDEASLCNAADMLVLDSADGSLVHLAVLAAERLLPVVEMGQAPSAIAPLAACQALAPTSNSLCDRILDLAVDRYARRRAGRAYSKKIAAASVPETIGQQWTDLIDSVLTMAEAPAPQIFDSFMQGGFECSTQRLRSGRRLDIIAAVGHDRHVEEDYRQLGRMGLKTVRDGLRWHVIEHSPGQFDFSSVFPMFAAAETTGTQVIWDLLHYGFPDDLNIWEPSFVDRFAAFAKASALAFRQTTHAVPFWCPVNEISFFSWAGGDAGYLNPFASGRGFELKVHLARASIAAMQALRQVDPRARFVHCEPLIAVHHDPATGRARWEAEGYHDAQFQAFDLLSGRIWPQIGGNPSYLDIVGVNYYPTNQWIHAGHPIDHDHPFYHPLSDLLFSVYARYRRPVLLSETGVEDERRAPWFRYVTNEVARARHRGVPVEGICLYPVMNHPGWDDDRDCHNGLLTQHFVGGQRGVYEPLRAEVSKVVRDMIRPEMPALRAQRRQRSFA